MPAYVGDILVNVLLVCVIILTLIFCRFLVVYATEQRRSGTPRKADVTPPEEP